MSPPAGCGLKARALLTALEIAAPHTRVLLQRRLQESHKTTMGHTEQFIQVLHALQSRARLRAPRDRHSIWPSSTATPKVHTNLIRTVFKRVLQCAAHRSRRRAGAGNSLVDRRGVAMSVEADLSVAEPYEAPEVIDPAVRGLTAPSPPHPPHMEATAAPRAAACGPWVGAACGGAPLTRPPLAAPQAVRQLVQRLDAEGLHDQLAACHQLAALLEVKARRGRGAGTGGGQEGESAVCCSEWQEDAFSAIA